MANHPPNTGFNTGYFPGQPQAAAGQYIGQPQANAGHFQGQYIGQSQANAGQFPGHFTGQYQANAGQYPDQSQVNVEQFAGQSQMWRNDLGNQPSDYHSHNQSNFLQDTGTQVKNMTQGAAEIGKGAALSVVNMARGAATGAANIAQGAAQVVKNKIGVNSPNTTSRPSDPGSAPSSPTSNV